MTGSTEIHEGWGHLGPTFLGPSKGSNYGAPLKTLEFLGELFYPPKYSEVHNVENGEYEVL